MVINDFPSLMKQYQGLGVSVQNDIENAQIDFVLLQGRLMIKTISFN